MANKIDSSCTFSLETGIVKICIPSEFRHSRENVPVVRVYTDKEFLKIKAYAKEAGFKYISSGRFVRSSYNAEDVFKTGKR